MLRARVVERWPGYWKHTPADDGFVEDGPYIDAWDTRIIPDSAAVKAAFLAGDLDVMGSESSGNIDPLELPEFEDNDNFNIFDIPVGATTLVGMDGGKFHDVRARLALQKAVDYEGFIAAIRQGKGSYTGPLSPLLGDLNQLGQEDYKKWMKYDPEEARALWEAAGSPIEDFKLLTNNGSALQLDIADFIGQSISQTLGVDYEIDGVDSNTWAARALDRSTDVKDWELLPYGDRDRRRYPRPSGNQSPGQLRPAWLWPECVQLPSRVAPPVDHRGFGNDDRDARRPGGRDRPRSAGRAPHGAPDLDLGQSLVQLESA